MGLYRDDGLGILCNTSGLRVERIRKDILKTVQLHGLQVTTETSMFETDFLDITLNLSSAKFWPNRKPNNQPLYIHAASNHPPIIKKHHKKLFYNKEEFKKAIPLYNKALKNSGYVSSFTFSRNNRNGKAEQGRETWYGSTLLTAKASKPTLAKSFLGFRLNTFLAPQA